MTVEINTTLKKKYFCFPSKKKLLKIKNKILGEKYDLSLVFIGEKLSKTLNKKYRNKNYQANILSFSIDRNIGEIFINISNIKKESVKWDMSQKKFLILLFIHGLAHLKGFNHQNEVDAKEMEKFEEKMRRKNII